MSLDALRGFDMFWIVGAETIVEALRRVSDSGPIRALAHQMEHADWAGFRCYDLIFPMFVFIVGVSLVFSLERIVEQEGRPAAVIRLVRRGALLYLLGIFYYGGFATPFAQIRLMGVLQRIALAYLFGGFLFCFLKPRGRIGVTVGLLVGYWLLMTFVPVPGVGAGNFEEGKNLANWIDREFLPLRKWDGDHDPEGLLSTLPAIATCLLGTFAGVLLRDRSIGEGRKAGHLVIAGVVLVALGWLWSLHFPVIKKIWTSSFVLVAGGYSAMLLGAFHWVIEVRHWRRWCQPFVWIGVNPLTIYLIHQVVNLEALAKRFVGGELGGYFGRYAQLLVAITVTFLTFWICRFLYQRRIFLRL